jgi:hypothetical protein
MDSFGELAVAAGVGAVVGGADQAAINSSYGQKPGMAARVQLGVGALASLAGSVGALALPRRSQTWRRISEVTAVSGFTLLGQSGVHALDQALKATSSGGTTPPTNPGSPNVPVTRTSTSGSAVSTGNAGASTSAAASGATTASGAPSASTAAMLALGSSELSFGAQ